MGNNFLSGKIQSVLGLSLRLQGADSVWSAERGFKMAGACFQWGVGMVLILTMSLFSGQVSAKKVDIENYAKFSEYGKTRISPDGQYIAMRTRKDDRAVVVILETKTLKPSHVVRFIGGDDQVGDFEWVAKNRLVVEVSRFVPSEMERPMGGGELFAVNADGSKAKRIFTYSLPPNTRKRKNSGIGYGGFAFLTAPLEEEQKYALVTACSFTGEVCDLFKINVFNGSLRDRQKLPPRVSPMSPAILDRDHQARYAVSSTEFGFREIYGREDKIWTLLGKYPYPGGALLPISVSDDGRYAYALDDRDGGPQAVVKVDRQLKNPELVYRHRLTDIRNYHTDSKGAMYAVEAGLGLPELVALIPDSKDLKTLKTLKGAFPGKAVEIVDQAIEGKLVLVAVFSDKIPPEYYILRPNDNQLQFLWSQRPWVKESESSAMQVVEFKSRDGLQITGYLTLPKNLSPTSKAPLIVNPHGGPHGPFDTWEYNPETQYLASIGYAVLQVNFRGSGGFGSGFEMAGFRKWGREIQHDIIDGAKYVLQNFPLDPDRVGIMGGSFGGYSALQSPIIAPELFKAAVGVVGVYDFSLMRSAGDIRGRFSGRRYLDKALGDDDAEYFEFSPIRRVSELKAPVLLVQGEKDERAPVKHSDVLAKRLSERNHPHQYVVMPNEGHGFYKLENRIRYYGLVTEFFDRYLKSSSI